MTDEEKQAKKEYRKSYYKYLRVYKMNYCWRKQKEVTKVANYYKKKK